MQEMLRIECDGNLCYNGNGSDLAAVKIIMSNGIFNFNGKIYTPIDWNSFSYPNYTEENNTKLIGLDFNSCNCSTLQFKEINGFNEGLRISDTNSNGCCYNTIYMGELVNANKCLRVYQEGGIDNWCNQNVFIGGRLWCHSAWSNQNFSHWKIYLSGAIEEGGVDHYDNVENLVFLNVCTEGGNAYYIRKGQHISIYSPDIEQQAADLVNPSYAIVSKSTMFPLIFHYFVKQFLSHVFYNAT
jgi:hypothetical protein